ncbi:MAG: translation elongation factor Ts [Planctomycetota bacterium]|nr:MAG: translation elongation factor Ts [Planctomycetota bacterium]
MKIDAKTVMKLRAETGAGMMDCKKALAENEGDIEKAKAWLRKRGQKIAEKKADRATNAGQIAAYIHAGGRIGVLLDLRCETDFVARTDDFQQLARDLCMHIAASKPVAVDREGIDEQTLEKEKEIFRAQVPAGKPPEVVEKIVQGKLNAFFKERCLLEQEFVKDPKVTIRDLLTNASAKLGENVRVERFTRYEIGG